MAAENVINLDSSNWGSEVGSSTQPVLVDFWAPWCGPCRRLAPAIDAIATRYAGKAKVGKVNTDNAQDLATQYNISGIPCVIIFKGGKEVSRLVGLQPESAFASELDRHV
jgi:thioredoxin 1